jgi:hypothetical protein
VYDWQDAVVLKNNLERIWIGECCQFGAILF